MRRKITNETHKKALHWSLVSGETGVSSEAIVSKILMGEVEDSFCHPRDPSDLNRCVMLLEAIPELGDHLDKMREVSPVWDELVSNWGDLCYSLEAEKKRKDGKAPITYRAMKSIIKEAESRS